MPFNVDSIRKMLPKNYLRKHVADEIFVAKTHFKTLVPMMDKYVYCDGTTKNLMSLSGTIPVLFNANSYNIPVCLWLEESYPQTAPICYVQPTRDMMILRGNYTSCNGEVELPYLKEWKSGECDLVSLLQVMQVMFGDCPPVCMQPLPEPERASCGMQFQRLRRADGGSSLSLLCEDGRPIPPGDESSC